MVVVAEARLMARPRLRVNVWLDQVVPARVQSLPLFIHDWIFANNLVCLLLFRVFIFGGIVLAAVLVAGVFCLWLS